MRSYDLAAQGLANWFVNQVLSRHPDSREADDLQRLAEYFTDIEKSLISIGDDDEVQIGCVSKSWDQGADPDDKIGCVVFFNGVYLTFDVVANIANHDGIILRVMTDFQGGVMGKKGDMMLFRAVAEKILASPDCKFYVEIHDIELSDFPF
jgi:hypothetical protein